MESAASRLRRHAVSLEGNCYSTGDLQQEMSRRKEIVRDLREAANHIEKLSEEIDTLNTNLEEAGWQLAEYRDHNERMEEVATSTVDTAEEIYNAREQIRIAHEQLEIQKEELNLLAITDPLTGVYNRRYLMSYIEEQSAVKGENLSILMMDIDLFKAVNDTYGHHAGDLALKTFTDLCLSHLPVESILGRLGGEEFAMALPGISVENAGDIAEKIRKKTEETVCHENDREFSFTVSIGVSCSKLAKGAKTDLLSHADNALYQAKETGRNQVVIASLK